MRMPFIVLILVSGCQIGGWVHQFVDLVMYKITYRYIDRFSSVLDATICDPVVYK